MDRITFPLAMLTKTMSKLRGDQPIFLVCANDKQSHRVTALLHAKNFTKVYALKGGIAGWSKPLKIQNFDVAKTSNFYHLSRIFDRQMISATESFDNVADSKTPYYQLFFLFLYGII